jgi:hypothetical protein
MTLAHWLTLGVAVAAIARIWWERREDNRSASRERYRLYRGSLED